MRPTALCAAAAALSAGLWGQVKFTPSVLALPGIPSQILYSTTVGVFQSATAGYTNQGVFRSPDAGLTWTPLYLTEAGLPQPTVRGFALDPTNSSRMFMATTLAEGAVWRSTDGGNTWVKANIGLPTKGPDPDYFALNPGNRALYLKLGNALYKSTDGAATWTMRSTLPGDSSSFNINPTSPPRMYYGSNEAFSRSDDEGSSWSFVSYVVPPPDPAPSVRTVINSMVSDYSDKNLVFVSMGGPDSGRLGVYRNTNAGQNPWEKVLADYIGAFFTGPTGPLYADSNTGGFDRTSNQGLAWTRIDLINGQLVAVSAVDPQSRNIVWGILDGQLARSIDSGDHWQTVAATLRPTLSKPAAPLTLSVEQGATSAVSLSVRAVEDANASFSFTASTSGEDWLSLDKTSGKAPGSLSAQVTAAALSVGNYSGTVRLSSPDTANASVDIPVQVTVIPPGSGGPRYTISTVGDVSKISLPAAVAIDSAGNLFVANISRTVWRVDAKTGATTLFAGNGPYGGAGDGGPATAAQLDYLDGIAVDQQGTVYISEDIDSRVRKVANGVISLVLDGKNHYPDGSGFFGAFQLATDAQNRLLLAAFSRIGRLTPPNVLSQVPMNGHLNFAQGVAVDSSGNIFVADSSANQVVRIATNGIATVVAGTGRAGFSGDGGPATAAALDSPRAVAVDPSGNVFIADTDNNRVRMVGLDGKIHTIAGTGKVASGGDGGPAINADLSFPAGLAADSSGNLFVAESGVRKLTLVHAPVPQVGGIGNAASGSIQVSPGGVFSVYGQNLAPGTLVTSSVPWPATLGVTSVTVNGIPAPLWFVSAGQINAQLPYEVSNGRARAIVTVNGTSSAEAGFDVVSAAPGLLVCGACGNGHVLAVNPDGSLNSASAPAGPGDYLVAYLIGIGPVDGKVATGGPAAGSPLPAATLPHSITIGGQPADFTYLGLTPASVALAQANVKVPDLPTGDYALVVTINGVASNSLQVSIRRP